MAQERCCGNCRFWVDYGGDGECHLNPPVVTLDPQGDVFSFWPEVLEDGWCGKHERSTHPPGDDRE